MNKILKLESVDQKLVDNNNYYYFDQFHINGKLVGQHEKPCHEKCTKGSIKLYKLNIKRIIDCFMFRILRTNTVK